MTGTRSIMLSGKSVDYSVVQSRRARRISLKLSPRSGLALVVPKRVKLTQLDVDELLMSKSRWILSKMRLLDRAREKQRIVRLAHGTRFSFLGREIEIIVEESKSKRDRVTRIGDTLFVSAISPDEEHVGAVVSKWLIREAKVLIPERVHEINKSVGHDVNFVGVRDQRSRWGSCSQKGNLNFNWRLVLIPPFVMDYLIYHELAHLKEHNHSERYWRLVARLCPYFQEAEAWLKKEGNMMFV